MNNRISWLASGLVICITYVSPITSKANWTDFILESPNWVTNRCGLAATMWVHNSAADIVIMNTTTTNMGPIIAPPAPLAMYYDVIMHDSLGMTVPKTPSGRNMGKPLPLDKPKVSWFRMGLDSRPGCLMTLGPNYPVNFGSINLTNTFHITESGKYTLYIFVKIAKYDSDKPPAVQYEIPLKSEVEVEL